MTSTGRLAMTVMISSCMTVGAMAGPFYVDLSSVANASRDDDRLEGRDQGGWTGEGINDMFLYPPLPVGDVLRNGYRFSLLDPDVHGGRAALMLRAHDRDEVRPKSKSVAIPDVSRRFVYIVHHSVGPSDASDGDPLARYTIHYADGESAEMIALKGRHLRHWWCQRWWDNSGADAWPVHMGRNVYTMKWRSLIGLWATRWTHPRPEAPIRSISFESFDRGGPVIWAVTLDDADYHSDEAALKADVWENPPAPPQNYFERKIAVEREAVYAAALREGHIEGVRSVEMIRSDLLAVTVDPALTRVAAGPCGEGRSAAATYQIPETFTITSTNDEYFRQGIRPVRVGRDSYEYWNGDIGDYPQNTIYWHTFYLQLPRALQSGSDYRVRVAGIEQPLRDALTLRYDESETETPVLKVNQVAYSTRATRRYAYLGWWAGDLGAVDYSDLERFEVVDVSNGRAVLDGVLVDREDPPGNSGEKVREIDVSGLTPGSYFIRVPGLGRSSSFAVGGKGIRDLYHHTQRAFYHQRCGFPLEEPFTRFEKPACHLWVYESGHMVNDPSYTPLPDEPKREFRGGYHDAADFDCFTYHLRATAQNLDAYEMYPDTFLDGDLNIPESGNGVPDLLDEAEWALRFWREQQAEDGAVPKGRCNDQDSRRQNHVQWGSFGIFQPDVVSNAEYAATAASFARLYRPFDAALADATLDSAKLALDWALAQPDAPEDESRNAFLLWAAGALFRATGETRYHELFSELFKDNGFRVHWRVAAWGPMMRWQYLRSKHPDTDPAILAQLQADILRLADHQLSRRLEAEAYRWGGDSTRGMGWGNANGGGHYADVLLRAWWLSGDQKYLDGVSLNADFQLGCNPLSKTFITGMGSRPPLHPQISAFLYEQSGKRGGTVRGITIYGITDREPEGWYPPDRPRLRRWRDLGNGSAEISSEFTVTETIGASAMLYGALYGIERQGE